jgi:hypothetical protein
MLPSLQQYRAARRGTWIVVQISRRRWVVAEQLDLFLHNVECRTVTRPFTNRIDAHTVCTELATRPPGDYSALTTQHLLDAASLRGRTYLRSHFLQGSNN